MYVVPGLCVAHNHNNNNKKRGGGHSDVKRVSTSVCCGDSAREQLDMMETPGEGIRQGAAKSTNAQIEK